LLLAGQNVKSFAFSQHRSHANCIGKNERYYSTIMTM
jgi:hypothetical protein